jgi:hypothetical protein
MPTLTFKVTAAEAALIRRQARREGRSLSEMLRRRAVQPPYPPNDDVSGYRVKRSRITGLPVMHAPAGVPRVTPEQIRALLLDFP